MKKKRVLALLTVGLIGGCVLGEIERQKSTKLEVDENIAIYKDVSILEMESEYKDNPEYGSTTITIDRATGIVTKDGVEIKGVKFVE